MRGSLLALGLGAATLISCSDVVDAPGEEGFEDAAAASGDLVADFEEDGVRLANDTGQTVYYLLYDPDLLAQYARCIGTSCPRLGPGDTAVVPFHLIPSADGADLDEVVIEFWNLVGNGPVGWRVENVRTLTLSR